MRSNSQQYVVYCFAIAASLLTAPTIAQAQSSNAQAAQMCLSDDADQRIPGCTWFINRKLVPDPLAMSAIIVRRAEAWIQKGDIEKGLADYALSIRTHPRPVSYGTRGMALMNLSRFDEALADFDTMVRMEPNNRDGYLYRGQYYAGQGRHDEAIAEYDLALAIAKRDPPYGNDHLDIANIRNSRANSLRINGMHAEAVSDYSLAIKINPGFLQAYANRSRAYVGLGKLDEAFADVQRVVSANPNHQIALVFRGIIWRYRGETQKAIADFSSALKIDPEFTIALTELGLTYEKAGRIAEAKRTFAAALGITKFYDTAFEAQNTARARLAALDAGAVPDALKPVPVVIPTNVIKIEKDVQPEIEKAFGKRVALIIGNSAYTKVPRLPNPARDAEKIAATLRGLGWQVVVGNDLSREKLLEALTLFSAEAKGADWAVVYYAGHGVEVNGQNYLIPVDAKLSSDRDVGNEAIPLDSVMTAVEGAKKLRLVMLDACRDNPFLPDMKRSQAPGPMAQVDTQGGKIATRSLGRGLGEVKVQGATLVVYAAKHGQVALDGTGANSPFALAVANRLATPGVEIYKIFRLVRDDVLEATQGRQEPFNYGSLPGSEDFYFVSK